MVSSISARVQSGESTRSGGGCRRVGSKGQGECEDGGGGGERQHEVVVGGMLFCTFTTAIETAIGTLM